MNGIRCAEIQSFHMAGYLCGNLFIILIKRCAEIQGAE